MDKIVGKDNTQTQVHPNMMVQYVPPQGRSLLDYENNQRYHDNNTNTTVYVVSGLAVAVVMACMALFCFKLQGQKD